ncbi:2Fe-2S iron-sulfur cluster-binding protein [Streptomyces sp. NPDC006510]|uniref:(2Fe-2S)-binding protein n=1 Tax=Streptomyces sp. NPDC006510 TaxID=3155600 RepID=UPI0033B206AA
MSNEDHNDQHGQQEHLRHGGWQPTPQGGEYDAEATAFVHLPPEDLANIPLAAPGQGYVPPMILPLTPAAGLDPSATGSWVVQTQSQQERDAGSGQPAPEAVHWPDPNHQQGPYDYEYPQAPDAPQVPHDAFSQEQYRETPAATGQWNFTESAEFGVHAGQADHAGHGGHAGQADHAGHGGHTGQADHAGHGGHAGQADHVDHTGHVSHGGPTGHTGQWTIPVADGDLPEESGEFAASALAAQWYGDRTPPATLPGGAPAPWATQQPAPEPEPEFAAEPALLADIEPEHAPEHEPGAEFERPSDEASSVAYEDALRAPEAVAAGPAPEAAPETEPAEAGPVPAAEDPHAADATPAPEIAPEQFPAGQSPQTSLDDAHDDSHTDAHTDGHDDAHTDAQEAARDADSADSAASADTAPVAAADPDTPPAPPLESEPPEAGSLESQSLESQPLESQPLESRPLGVPDEHPAASYVLHVNGADRPVTDAWIGESLLYVLRERLGLAGAKDGCSQGECGACNVQVDGRLVASCLVPAATAAGSEVRTVEGLAVDGEPSDVQRALAKCGAVQCGFCIPGMAMTVHDLLEGNHAPSELETRQALCGNLCRCSGYRGVLDAVNEVIAGREATLDPASSDSTPPEPDEARIPHQAAPGAGGIQSHPQDGGMA